MESINTWRFKSKCFKANSNKNNTSKTNDFFPKSSEASESKKFCTDCPVISLCKTYAVAHDEYGIWGGTTRHERERYDPKFIEIIREMYYQARLLEFRSSEPVAKFLKRKQELQQEQQQAHIAAQQVPLDSILDQSLVRLA